MTKLKGMALALYIVIGGLPTALAGEPPVTQSSFKGMSIGTTVTDSRTNDAFAGTANISVGAQESSFVLRPIDGANKDRYSDFQKSYQLDFGSNTRSEMTYGLSGKYRNYSGVVSKGLGGFWATGMSGDANLHLHDGKPDRLYVGGGVEAGASYNSRSLGLYFGPKLEGRMGLYDEGSSAIYAGFGAKLLLGSWARIDAELGATTLLSGKGSVQSGSVRALGQLNKGVNVGVAVNGAKYKHKVRYEPIEEQTEAQVLAFTSVAF